MCASPWYPYSCSSFLENDHDSDIGSDDRWVGGGDAGIVVDLSGCAPTSERVICIPKVGEVVMDLVDHSHLFVEGNRDFLYSPAIWAQINNKLVTPLVA